MPNLRSLWPLWLIPILLALAAPAPAQPRARRAAAPKSSPAQAPAAEATAEQPSDARGPAAPPAAEDARVPTTAPQSTPTSPADRAPEAEAAAPAPVELAPAAAPASGAAPAADPKEQERAQFAALQAELSQVMDDLVQARTRAAVLGKSLFQTRVRVRVDNRAAPDQTAARVQLWLDGLPIFDGDGSALRDPERVLWEGFAAPGAHALTLEIEQRARGDESYRYTLRESYRFMVVRELRTDLRLVLEDDSDMADDFPDDHEGSYEVQTRLTARAVRGDDD